MSDSDHYTDHISQQFNVELEQVKSRMLEMGGMVEKQVSEAVAALLTFDSAAAEHVWKNDKIVNAMESEIDEECSRILARRQPAASDLRLVLAISKAVSDLERIGDEAAKIARQCVLIIEEGESTHGMVEVRHITALVTAMVRDSLDAFARADANLALKVAQSDKSVDQEYASAIRTMVTYMMEDPRNISRVLNLIWILRSLERVGDHSRNIAEHVIYLAKGKDVRHLGLKQMAAELEKP